MTLRPALTALLSDPFAHDAIRAAYDTVAVDYTREFGDDLARLPLDREMLDTALTAASGCGDAAGWTLEVGCGPAPAASYFAERVGRILAVDLSGAMLDVAGSRNQNLPRTQADRWGSL